MSVLVKPIMKNDYSDPPATGLRQRKKSKMRTQLKQAALALFVAQGYTQTTVEQIADAVEISPRTFFRYFENKEDLLFEDDSDEQIIESFRRQPKELSPVMAIANAYRTTFQQMPDQQIQYEAQKHAVISQTPELATRNTYELVRNLNVVTSLIAERLEKSVSDTTVQTLAGAIFGVVLASYTTDRPLPQSTSIRKTPVFSSEKAEKGGGDPVGSSTSFEGFAAEKTGVLAGGGLGKRSNKQGSFASADIRLSDTIEAVYRNLENLDAMLGSP
jgi:AcrR family transcriptional regulator